MVLIWESLYDALHEVLLCKSVFAHDYNVEDPGQDSLLVDFVGNTFKATKTNNIFPDSDTKLIPLNFSLLTVW